MEYLNGIKIVTINDEFEIASAEVKQQRLDICGSCEKNTGDSCSECSCLLSVRTAYRDSFCPLEKW